jgi:histidyl-tRNA synthetase
MSETVVPRLSRGLRDLLPDQMLARQQMVDVIRGVYENFMASFALSTPAIEFLDVLSGSAGQEAQQSIFRVIESEETDESLGLRFDLTVPLARVISQYDELPRPFRRYQVAPVWRADKPDKGRYREFTQFDLDSVGVESEIADTEIIAGMCDTLSASAFPAISCASPAARCSICCSRLEASARSRASMCSACSTSSTRSVSTRSNAS